MIVEFIVLHVCLSFFFEITQYNADTQHARTLTPMNTRTQTLLLWAPSKDWAGKSWSSPSHHRRLAVDGHVATQHARTLTPMNTRTQTLLLWAPSKDWAGKSWSSPSHHRRLAVDGHVAYHLMYSVGKSWNKSRIKCRTQDLNPGWEPPNQWPLPLRREPLEMFA